MINERIIPFIVLLVLVATSFYLIGVVRGEEKVCDVNMTRFNELVADAPMPTGFDIHWSVATARSYYNSGYGKIFEPLIEGYLREVITCAN